MNVSLGLNLERRFHFLRWLQYSFLLRGWLELSNTSSDSILEKMNEYLINEKSSNTLTKLPRSIYRDVTSHIRMIRVESNEKDDNVINKLKIREKELLHKISERLIRIRVEKFLNCDGGKNLDENNFTDEEMYLVEPMINFRKRLDKITEAISNGRTGFLEIISDSKSSKYTVVRILQNLPPTLGTDLARYGPFNKGDVAIIPVGNARPLLKQGLIQEVELDI